MSDPSLQDALRQFRRRWTSGVAIVTAVPRPDEYRGITITAMMPVSLEPPVVAVCLTADGTFASFLGVGGAIGVSILDLRHEFWSERFAGRAPVPDANFGGIGHRLEGGVPVIDGALASCVGLVRSIEPVGDHLLVLVDVEAVAVGEDTDDPLVTYEARYRRLEVG